MPKCLSIPINSHLPSGGTQEVAKFSNPHILEDELPDNFFQGGLFTLSPRLPAQTS